MDNNKNPFDLMNMYEDKCVQSILEPGEKILLSSLIYKFNHVNKKQERILCVTNKNIYNILPPKFLSNLLSKVINSARIKRKIPLNKLFGLTVSRFGYQFIIHVPGENDYLLKSENFREQIINTICFAYYEFNQKKMAFFYKDDLTLMQYCTTKIDVKNKLSNMPKDQPQVKKKKIINFLKQKKYLDPESMSGNENAVENDQKLSIEDFHLIKVLGRGAFGKVMLCQKKDTNELYAIKSMRKEDIIDKDQIEHTKAERKILEQVNFPFLVNLEYAFQTREKVFFAMKFLIGGELFFHLKRQKRFTEQAAAFYSAQVLLALEYLHQMNVVYRDLKPENILMDEEGYIKLTDFGLAKQLEKDQLTHSFVGTPDYIAPEIINMDGHNILADYWALGILIYEMVIGIPPFYNNNQSIMFQNIIEKDVRFPQSVPLSKECMDIVIKLLQKNPEERLGYKDVQDIKNHPFFKEINFDDLIQKKIQAPTIPKINNNKDVGNFESEFTEEDARNSFVNSGKNIELYQRQFQGMTFVPVKNDL
ncbi:protein kinase domain protein [Ichthyophthirius multifiliis]|uniref:non-specific serine/threonine protein kinase n=1 Tax=Ichthyophthirius multifiliis TaxID=5932 RepID=G0QUX8_ICHMU|nr:protein kinase domain protein [Ichthyophthirius multifiliis]EGR30983.1 protein kinase domain protein [Ichthyophthirius multifiliis]|eukprot:XP_004034469.1 protein kinase domain protein [Ichthyophthirius multifiliis]